MDLSDFFEKFNEKIIEDLILKFEEDIVINF